MNIKLKYKVVRLKEEKNHVTKLFVISRSRPEIDVEALFKIHEFSVVPRSLFDATGKPRKCTDKSAYLHGLEKLIASDSLDQNLTGQVTNSECLVIDGMGLVNQLKISSNILTVKDLAESLCSRINKMLRGATIIVLIFDSYSQGQENIKAQTWETRHKKQVRYQLSETTNIKNLKMKNLLSHPENKKTLMLIFSNVFFRIFHHYSTL